MQPLRLLIVECIRAFRLLEGKRDAMVAGRRLVSAAGAHAPCERNPLSVEGANALKEDEVITPPRRGLVALAALGALAVLLAVPVVLACSSCRRPAQQEQEQYAFQYFTSRQPVD